LRGHERCGVDGEGRDRASCRRSPMQRDELVRRTQATSASRAAWLPKIRHTHDGLRSWWRTSVCPMHYAIRGQHPVLASACERRRVRTPAVHGYTSRGLLARVAGPGISVLALGRFTHYFAEVSRELRKSQFQSRSLASEAPGCTSRCAGLPNRACAEANRCDAQQSKQQQRETAVLPLA